jgi:hypothetical protein
MSSRRFFAAFCISLYRFRETFSPKTLKYIVPPLKTCGEQTLQRKYTYN